MAKTRKQSSRSEGRIMRLSSYLQKDAAAMDSTIRKGPMTLVFIYTKTCPHCHTYMPIWNKLCKTNGRKANMISMEASTYQQTPMSQKKPVSGVPTVLYVNKQGEIVEIDKPRDTATMKSVVRNMNPSSMVSSQMNPKPMTPKPMTPTLSPMASKPMTPTLSPMASKPMTPTLSPMNPKPMASSQMNSIQPPRLSPIEPNPNPMNPIQTPGLSQDKRYTNSPLKPLPATGGHRGGNWDAVLTAVPAAALLGAYAAFPMQRSSGLGPTRKRRRH